MKRNVAFFILAGLLATGVDLGFLFARTLNLDYSTYLGGSEDDIGYGISVGSDGMVYVTGSTCSLNFPTKNPYQASNAGEYYGSDAFVSVFNSSGSTLSYSTYLGGTEMIVGMDSPWGQKARPMSPEEPTLQTSPPRTRTKQCEADIMTPS